MGGAHGKGYVRSLKSYIRNSKDPQINKVLISLVADFDPFQGGDLSADKDIFTQQFWHYGGVFGLADQIQSGAEELTENAEKSSHSIITFLDNVSDLQEGTYVWNEQKKQWVCTTCKD